MNRGQNSSSSGFTLLEVLLTLSMSVVLMMLIGGVLQFYGRDMQTSDLEIRQVQLATAVMQMIEDELRATLYTEPVDTSGLAALLSAVGGGGGDGDDGGDGGDPATTEEDTDATDAAEMLPSDSEEMNLAAGIAVLQKPGLIGNQFQIQFDVSRLPRLEEYVLLLDGVTGDLDDLPSDIKSVAYYVQEAGSFGGVGDPLENDGANPDPTLTAGSGGLVRRSLDRAATVHASMTGGLARLNQTGDLLAPEVVAIEFAYWDGFNWQIEWSSDGYGGLPLAVRVTLTMLDPVASRSAAGTLAAGTSAEMLPTRAYAHVVRLPLAKPIDMTEMMTSGVGVMP